MRTLPRQSILTCALLFSLLTGRASDSTAKEKAIRLVRQAMDASGGFGNVATLTLRTKRLNYNKWQNYSFRNPKPNHDEAFSSYDFRNRQYFYKTIGRYAGGYVFEFATIGKDSLRYNYDVRRNRNGREVTVGNKKAMEQGFHFIDFFLPYYLLQALASSTDSLSLSEGTGVAIVKRSAAGSGSTEYHFNAQSKRLVRIVSGQPGLVSTTTFSKYREQSGLVYPGRIEVRLNGEMLTTDEVLRLEINKAFDTGLLRLPEGYVLAPQGPAGMRVEKLGGEAYVIENVPTGRNVLFVSLDSGILVTDAPQGSEVSKAVIALIKKTLPGKPIRYVHVSHFHNDHTNGIRAFVHEGATIITTPDTQLPLLELIGDSSGRFKDDLARSKRPARFLLFSGKHVLPDARQRVEFYELKSSHAEGMSFVYLPQEGLLYEGDLYSMPDDRTLTPAIAINREFFRFLQKNRLRPTRIIGHHGSSGIRYEDLEAIMKMK